MKFWLKYFLYISFITFGVCREREFVSCGELGCINFTKQWFDAKYRPVNFEPLKRHTINTKFLLLNSCSAPNTLVFDTITTNPDTVSITKYSSAYSLIMLIHDFTSNGYTGWIKHMAMVLIDMEQYNVIAVDWQEGAEPPLDQAIANARIVALEIDLLLRMLEDNFGLIMGQVQLIGHGVGAHIAGYTGKSIGRIGRITGLDPTGPRFEGMPDVVRLSPKDAFYVEVLHTDGEGVEKQGTLEPMGNTDFYFNEGFDQPGCYVNTHYEELTKIRRSELESGEILRGCSHKRAFKYYIEALQNEKCQIMGFRYRDTIDYTQVGCVDPENGTIYCAPIGLNVDSDLLSKNINLKFMVETARKAPFCLSPYYMKMEIAKCKEADQEQKGYFSVMLEEERTNNIVNGTFNLDTTFSDTRVLEQGKPVSHLLLTSSYGMMQIKSAKLKFHFTTPFCFRCKNTTCVSKFNVTQIKAYNGYVQAPVVNNFCTTDTNNYTVLVDGVCSTPFKKC